MLSFTGFISLLLLLPYLAWGIHTLRVRYVLREEIPLKIEGLTLALVVFFFVAEIFLSRQMFSADRLTHVLALLGLFVSGTALYGPLANAFFSKIIVNFLIHGEEHAVDQPRFGPVEALESQGKYEDALNEYIVIARIYPWHAGVYLRIAELCLRMKEHREAVLWLDRGLKHLKSAGDCQPILLRLCDIFSEHLDQADESRRILHEFIGRFPDTQEAASIRKRLEKNNDNFCAQVSTLLEDMQAISLKEAKAPGEELAKSPIQLEAMDKE